MPAAKVLPIFGVVNVIDVIAEVSLHKLTICVTQPEPFKSLDEPVKQVLYVDPA